MRHVEVRLLQVHDVDEFVLEHPAPMKLLRHRRRRNHCHHFAGAGAYGAHVRQADHAGAEPTVPAGVAGAIEDFQQRFVRRFVTHRRDHRRVHFAFQVPGRRLRENFVLAAIELDDEVFGLQHGVTG